MSSNETSSGGGVAQSCDLGWCRYVLGDHALKECWHSISAIGGGAIFTECGGSMSVADGPWLEARPALVDRCVACVARRAQRKLVEQGLVELVSATEVMR